MATLNFQDRMQSLDRNRKWRRALGSIEKLRQSKFWLLQILFSLLFTYSIILFVSKMFWNSWKITQYVNQTTLFHSTFWLQATRLFITLSKLTLCWDWEKFCPRIACPKLCPSFGARHIPVFSSPAGVLGRGKILGNVVPWGKCQSEATFCSRIV